ncbi:MAG TPA: hypothetical protein PKW35_25525 [Nannocystaceae bacterium]|nr:hypothetical protein [Nannocystaceae bacterium]
MSEPMDDLRERFHKGLADLRTLRDEIGLKLHLAGMDARQAWEQLEPRIAELESQAQSASESAAQATDKVIAELREALGNLRKKVGGEPGSGA